MAKRNRRPSSDAASRSTRAKPGPSTRSLDLDAEVPALVYIHGIGRQEPHARCKREWDVALFGKDMQARTAMAYWADVNHPELAGAGPARTRSLGDDLEDDDGEIDIDEVLDESGAPEDARAWAEALARRIEGESGPIGTRGVHAKVLPLPRWMRRRLTAFLTKTLIRDTAAYFFDKRKREAMRARLRDRLVALAGREVVLVAHSQGSIIAHDVLTELGAGVNVVHWITLGSPLGLQEVQDHLKHPLRVPPGVQAWSNFADLLDPVALDKGLAGDFAPHGRVAVDDTTVVNRSTLKIRGFNPHSSTGYLGVKAVRRTILGAAGEADDRVARFVVARDVRDEMTDAVGRHPVLIEVRDPVAYSLDEDGNASANGPLSLDARRHTLIERLAALTGGAEDACIDPLKRFVAARLTAAEIVDLSEEHREYQVYAVWRNSRKRALLHRSADVIQAPPAQIAYRARGEGITWAVLDTGIQASHDHFAKRIESAWDCTGKGAPKLVKDMRDPDGHGTHVAGIIAGSGEHLVDGRTQRISGIAPEARVRVYKVLEDDGSGEDAWIIKALDHIAEANERAAAPIVHGVNLSLGGPFDPEVYGCGHSPICQELRRLWRQGVLVCVACGNEGLVTVQTTDGEVDLNSDLSIGDPANLEEAIAVGSVNADRPHLYGVSYFSSRGPTADGRSKPDVVAPGERILSCGTRKKAPYVEQSGTSMACPHVSGLLAAFLSVRREFIGRPDEVKRILLANTTDLGRDRYHQGAGLPNLVKMLANT